MSLMAGVHTFVFIMATVTCFARAGTQFSIACQEKTEEVTACESVNAWLCQMNEWTESIMEWKDLVEQRCSPENLGTEWGELFSCEEPVMIDCTNQDAHRCEYDSFNCTICYCEDGKYRDRRSYIQFWRRRHFAFKQFLKVYDEKLLYCEQSNECSVSDPTPTVTQSIPQTPETTGTSADAIAETTTTEPRDESSQPPIVTSTFTHYPQSKPQTQEITEMSSANGIEETTSAAPGSENSTAGLDCSVFLDVMFVVDGSGSVGSDNFNLVKEWLIDQTLEINGAYGSCVRLEVLQYSNKDSSRDRIPIEESNKFEIPFTLNDDFSNCESCFREGINNMSYLGGQTFTYYALRRVMEVEFPNSFRYNISRKIVIVVTDGEANDGAFFADWYDVYKDDVIPFAIGVGNSPSISQLRTIANGNTGTERVIIVSDFEYLDRIQLLGFIEAEIEGNNETDIPGTQPST